MYYLNYELFQTELTASNYYQLFVFIFCKIFISNTEIFCASKHRKLNSNLFKLKWITYNLFSLFLFIFYVQYEYSTNHSTDTRQYLYR